MQDKPFIHWETNMPYTTQAQVRAAFWRDNPQASRRKVRRYSGKGTMHDTDTRCAFVDYVDHLCRNGDITTELAARVTL
jgi:hypothetical protein